MGSRFVLQDPNERLARMAGDQAAYVADHPTIGLARPHRLPYLGSFLHGNQVLEPLDILDIADDLVHDDTRVYLAGGVHEIEPVSRGPLLRALRPHVIIRDARKVICPEPVLHGPRPEMVIPYPPQVGFELVSSPARCVIDLL